MATPEAKRVALSAAATAIATDGRITVQEAELFRAVAETLECPIPPMALYGAVET